MNKNIIDQFAKMIVIEYCPFEKLISSVMINNISIQLQRIYYKYITYEYVESIFQQNEIIHNNDLYYYEDVDDEYNYEEIRDAINELIINITNILSDSSYDYYYEDECIRDIMYIPLDIYKCLQLASLNYLKNNKHFHRLYTIRSLKKPWDKLLKEFVLEIKKFDYNGDKKEDVDMSLTIEEIKESLENGDEVHFYLEESVYVLVKDNTRFEEIWFDKKEFELLDLSVNDQYLTNI